MHAREELFSRFSDEVKALVRSGAAGEGATQRDAESGASTGCTSSRGYVRTSRAIRAPFICHRGRSPRALLNKVRQSGTQVPNCSVTHRRTTIVPSVDGSGTPDSPLHPWRWILIEHGAPSVRGTNTSSDYPCARNEDDESSQHRKDNCCSGVDFF